MQGFLAVTDEPLVSVDFKCSDVSTTIDASLTMVLGDDLVKVVAWYGEWSPPPQCSFAHPLRMCAPRNSALQVATQQPHSPPWQSNVLVLITDVFPTSPARRIAQV